MPDRPLILAIEPDRKQAAAISALARGQLNAELILVDRAEPALDALAHRVPDLVLTSLLLSPRDEAALTERLRDLDAAGAHVQTLMIPVLATPGKQSVERNGLLTRLRRSRTRGASPDGCDPVVFGAQITEYLERAASEHRDRASSLSSEQHPTSEPDFGSVDRRVESPIPHASERDTAVRADTNSHILRDLGILEDRPIAPVVAAASPKPSLAARPPAPAPAAAAPAASILLPDGHEASWEPDDALPSDVEVATRPDVLTALEPTDSDLAEFVAVLQSMNRSESIDESQATLAPAVQPDEEAFWMLPPRAMWPRLESLVGERRAAPFVDAPQPVLAAPAPVKVQSRRPSVMLRTTPRAAEYDTATFDPDEFGFTALLAKLENSTL